MHVLTKPNPEVVMELLDAGSVAKVCACSLRTVRRLADTGRMPKPIRLNGLVRWRRAEVLAWISAGCPASQFQKGSSR